MGDIADFNIEQGFDEYYRHLDGLCDDFCPYCYEEEERSKIDRMIGEGVGDE